MTRRVVRDWLRWLVALVLFRTAVPWVKWHIRRRSGVIVLVFHRVLGRSELRDSCSPRGMLVSADIFAKIAEYLTRKYNCISLADKPEFGSASSTNVRVAVTFDDGWQDNSEVAHPICTDFSLPVTIFICPEKCGLKHPFWPERVTAFCRAIDEDEKLSRQLRALLATHFPGSRSEHLRSSENLIGALKVWSTREREMFLSEMNCLTSGHITSEGSNTDSTLTWDEIKKLHALGVTFGSHTQSHEILPSSAIPVIHRELVSSRTSIQKELAVKCDLLAYPNGDTSETVIEATRMAGYELAFTTRPGVWTSATDPFAVPRVNIWEGKVTNPLGHFSPALFEHAVFWRPYRCSREIRSSNEPLRNLKFRSFWHSRRKSLTNERSTLN
jgi:peptidoglycan/xylan/chitin deacetylase (PgdA/CDA1 family)